MPEHEKSTPSRSLVDQVGDRLGVRGKAFLIAVVGTLVVLALFLLPSGPPKGLEPPTPEERAAIEAAARVPIVVYTRIGDTRSAPAAAVPVSALPATPPTPR